MANLDNEEIDYQQQNEIDFEEISSKEADDLIDEILNDIAGIEEITFDCLDIAEGYSTNSLPENGAQLINNPSESQENFTHTILQSNENVQVEATTNKRKKFNGDSCNVDGITTVLPKLYEQQLTSSSRCLNIDTNSSLKDVQEYSSSDAHKKGPTKVRKLIRRHWKKSLIKHHTVTQYKSNLDQIPCISIQDSVVSNVNTNSAVSETLNDCQNWDVIATHSTDSLRELDLQLFENPSANQEEFTCTLLQDMEYNLETGVTTDARNRFFGGSNMIDGNTIAFPKIYEPQLTSLSRSHNNENISILRDAQKYSSTHAHKEGQTKIQKHFHQHWTESLIANNARNIVTQSKLHTDQIPNTRIRDSVVSKLNMNYAAPNTSNDWQSHDTIRYSVRQFNKTVKKSTSASGTYRSSFNCFVCGKDVGTKSGLTNHMAITHDIGK